MITKISSMIDDIADRLEAKGFIKEALELDRISDSIEKVSGQFGKFQYQAYQRLPDGSVYIREDRETADPHHQDLALGIYKLVEKKYLLHKKLKAPDGAFVDAPKEIPSSKVDDQIIQDEIHRLKGVGKLPPHFSPL